MKKFELTWDNGKTIRTNCPLIAFVHIVWRMLLDMFQKGSTEMKFTQGGEVFYHVRINEDRTVSTLVDKREEL